MSTRVRSPTHTELETLLPTLVELLGDAVDAGASLGFLPPLAHGEGRDYWLSLRPELRAASRLLLAAWSGERRLVGTGQLALPSWADGRHRAEIQKLFVATALKGRGLGRSLMAALHDAARERGRSLLRCAAW